MVASELVSDAVTYANGGRLRVWLLGTVRVEVEDTGGQFAPANVPTQDTSLDDRRLEIDAALANRWGVKGLLNGGPIRSAIGERVAHPGDGEKAFDNSA